MTTRIALVHATQVAISPIEDAFLELWPEAERVNLLDDSLSIDRGSAADLSSELFERFTGLTRYAKLAGAQGVLYTCSAFGPAIEAAGKAVNVPVLKPNEAMFADAVSLGKRIGMLATFESAIPTMVAELEEMAGRHGKAVEITVRYVPGALAALREGRADAHDELIVAASREIDTVDALLLAQFSMARARRAVQAAVVAPVLTSPNSAVLALRKVLER